MGDLAEFGANVIGAHARNKVRTHLPIYSSSHESNPRADEAQSLVEQREDQGSSRRAKVSCERQG